MLLAVLHRPPGIVCFAQEVFINASGSMQEMHLAKIVAEEKITRSRWK
jgi:hypothetical protein